MTMVNLVLQRHKALVAVDTGGVNLESNKAVEGARICKLIILPQSNVIITGRGHAAFISFIALMSLLSADASLAALDAQMPKLFKAATSQIGAMCKALLKPGSAAADLFKQEIYIIGWCAAEQRMKAICHQRTSLFGGIKRTELVGDDRCPDVSYSPYEPSWGEPPVHPDDAAGFQQLAAWQAKQMAQHHPEEAISVSGDVVLAMAMSDRVSVRTLGPVGRVGSDTFVCLKPIPNLRRN